MANRIIGNVLIVDSAMGNSPVILDSQIKDYRASAIAVWTVNNSALITFTGVDTANDLIFKFNFPAASADLPNPKWHSFGIPQSLYNMRAPVVSAGTAFIYLV